MIKKLQKKYALSEQGAKDLIKGCLACVLQNLSFMFPVGLLYYLVSDLMNLERKHFLVTHDKDCWWQMIQLLPSSYNQRRTVTMTYENVMNMLDYREGHKLDEWREFCEILRALPHVEVIRNGK